MIPEDYRRQFKPIIQINIKFLINDNFRSRKPMNKEEKELIDSVEDSWEQLH